MFIRPCEGRITSEFNLARLSPVLNVVRPHWGVDFGGDGSTTIIAAASGTVMEARMMTGYGNAVFVLHTIGGKTSETVYAHLRSIRVKVGESVNQGQVIGVKGTTGDSTGVHLHFEIHLGGRWNNEHTYAVNPIPLIIDEDIKKLQDLLNQTGEKLIVDGKHGPVTDKAIRDFQKKNQLVVDGIPGPATMAKLNAVIAALDLQKGEIDVSKDRPVSATHKDAWERAQKLGFFNGERPAESITREQAATVVMRVYDALMGEINK